MPINEKLPNKKFPMKFKYGEKPQTRFLEHLNAIKVKLMDAPTRKQVEQYLPEFALCTWEDKPRNDYTEEERQDAIQQLFSYKLLPTAMETIGFTFLISNIDLIDVTHLIRHRTMSFSAHCTGDRDQRHDTMLMKPSILASEFATEFMDVCEQAMNLYARMIDDGTISILDARTIIPRCSENHYYARVCLKDLLHYLQQRLDRQIQPESDNIIAFRMLIEVAKIFPEIKQCININAPDAWYVKTAQTDHSSNLYMPEDRNDVFEYKPQWFVYPRKRSEMLGGEEFIKLWERLLKEYDRI